jgi:hypothetical protein
MEVWAGSGVRSTGADRFGAVRAFNASPERHRRIVIPALVIPGSSSPHRHPRIVIPANAGIQPWRAQEARCAPVAPSTLGSRFRENADAAMSKGTLRYFRAGNTRA